MNPFAKKIIHWYEKHGRQDLPWQTKRTPYYVWISEIMLQQTQVSTVIPYFQRFIKTFPTVEKLALSHLDLVLTHWSGLGYYSRARNLHHAAKQIMAEFNGKIPNELNALVSLKGIGRSTAGAILSLGFNKPYPILDGNVKRVLTRFHAIQGWYGQSAVEKKLWTLSEKYVPLKKNVEFTQAFMDLGAILCTPKNPDCPACPLHNSCIAYKNNAIHLYPTPKPKKVKPRKEIQFLVFITPSQQLFLEQRPPTGIWGGLWSFPEYTGTTKTLKQWCKTHFNIIIANVEHLPTINHQFTHYDLTISPLLIEIPQPIKLNPHGQWAFQKKWLLKGLPAPTKRLVKTLNISFFTNRQEVSL